MGASGVADVGHALVGLLAQEGREIDMLAVGAQLVGTPGRCASDAFVGICSSSHIILRCTFAHVQLIYVSLITRRFSQGLKRMFVRPRLAAVRAPSPRRRWALRIARRGIQSLPATSQCCLSPERSPKYSSPSFQRPTCHNSPQCHGIVGDAQMSPISVRLESVEFDPTIRQRGRFA
jgi:hypothetical protein